MTLDHESADRRTNVIAPAQLHDLEAAPNQTQNIFEAYPEAVKTMAAELKRFRTKKERAAHTCSEILRTAR